MNSIKKANEEWQLYLVIALLIVLVLFYSSSQTYGQQSQASRIDEWLPNQPFKAAWRG